MIEKSGIKARFDALAPFLNERDRRLFAASEVRAAGRGGIAAVAEVTGVAWSTIGRLLGRLGFSLQANRKTREGTQHPDRNAQFEHINATVAAFQTAGEPAISVDTKKKELVGDFKNGGRELRPKGTA